MRIVHVVRQYAPSVGGLESVVGRLASEQRHRLGHSVRIVTLDRLFIDRDRRLLANEVIDGIPVTRLAWTGSTRYPLCPQVLTELRDADLVHVHAIDFFFDWLSLTRLVHRKPLIASTHGGFFHTAFASRLKKAWFQTVTRFSAHGYRRIVATSDNDGRTFGRIAGDRVVVIENGADIQRFHDAASPALVPVMIYFGRWSTNKGLLELIDLAAALRARDERWRLIVAGRPHDLSSLDLSKRIAAHGLQSHVEMHEAPSDDALRGLIARASYFACLSHYEGFGIAAIEAMSAGLVPVLSDIPPFRKLVEQSGCGLVLPLGSAAEEHAKALLAFVAAAEEPHGRERRMTFTRAYEWSRVVDRYEAVYHDALLGDPPGLRSAST